MHNEVHRDVFMTQEWLFIKSGRVQVDFYDSQRQHVIDVILAQGDVVLLAAGGHGFPMLEPTEMIEVKQGGRMRGSRIRRGLGRRRRDETGDL